MKSSDLDEEVCWESPLINTTAANPVSIKMDLTWATFDVDAAGNNCIGDYIKVLYSVNGGAYTMIPNAIGSGNPCATVAYPLGSTPPALGTVMINHGGITGGSTLKIRVCVFTNTTADIVTIDNVEVPEAGVSVGCAAPTLSTVVTPVGCSNPNSGAIDLTVSGGTPGYTYAWMPGGATTQDLTNKTAGTYTVTVTDAASCAATITATIGNAPTLTLTTQVLDASCSGNSDGEVSLDVTGGVPGYTYDWSNDGSENPDNDAQDLVGVGTGTYTVTVTDASGCPATKSATVGVLPSGAYNEQFNVANKGYLTNYVDDFAGVAWTMGPWTVAPPGSFGRTVNDYFRTSGGALVGINFDQEICWTSPLIELNGGTQFSVFLSWVDFDQEDYINVNYSIDGGAYIQVANAGGTGGTGTIDYPPPALDQDGSITVTKTGLSGGTIQIQVCGNFNTESMTIDNVSVPGSNNYCPGPEPSLAHTNVTCNGAANGTITNTVTDGTAPYTYAWSDGGVTTQNRTGLAPGTYTVTVTDGNMLTGSASATIMQPTAISITHSQTNVVCNGGSGGSISPTPSGGTPSYTYNWGGGITTQNRSGLVAGTYTVIVTDQNSCPKTMSFTITEPPALTVMETHVNVLCNGNLTGSIDLTPSGGTPSYTYNWGGGVFTQDRTNLAAGTYTVTVTDANACATNTSVTITEPATALTLTETHVDVQCNGNSTGSIDLTPSGGTGSYIYSWTGGATTQDRSGLAAGTYTVTVTDANLCATNTSVTIMQPTAIMLTETHVNVLCNGNFTGSIDLSVSGGNSPYTYDWSNDGSETPDNDTQDLLNLAAGTYTVTVTDASMCATNTSVTIAQPTAILLSTTQVNVLCNGNSTGSIDLTPSGGTSPYTYDWSNDGPETPDNDTQDLLNLATGTYTVTVTDANMCATSTSVTITDVSAIILTETHVDVLCNGGSTGSIDLSVSGGNSPYTYDWSNDGPETPDNDTQDLLNLVAGTYTVTVTDANMCATNTSVTIMQPTALSLGTTQVDVLCNGNSTGSIDLTPSGGTPAYTYDWSNDGPETPDNDSQDLSGLAAGTYTVTVTDANSCATSTSVIITQPTALSLSSTVVNPSNCFVADGSIDLSVSGGVPGYTYDWSNDGAENPDNDPQDLLNLVEGTYTVTVTDANGCVANHSKTLDYIDVIPPTISCPGNIARNTDTNQCTAVTTYSVTASDNCSYTLTLTSPANTASGSAFSKGTTTVSWQVTDASNLSTSCSFTVTVTDAQLPTITCPANIVRSNDPNLCSASVTYATPTASDNCALAANQPVWLSGGTTPTTNGANSTSTFDKGTTTVEWKASDTASPANTKTCTFTVTVNDTQKPTIACPANKTQGTDPGECEADVTYLSPTASDNCMPLPVGEPKWISGGTMPTASGPNSTSTFQKGVTTVTWKATDEAGNTKTCTFKITVNDLEKPMMTCLTDISANNDAGLCSAVVTYTLPTFTDNCPPTSGQSVKISGPASGSAFSVGTSNVVYRATDASGNTKQCTLKVIVTDNQPPTIGCPGPIVVTGSGTPCKAVASYATPTASDNCSGSLTPFLLSGLASGSQFPPGVTTNTWRAIAGNGQSADCAFTVTVNCPEGMGGTGNDGMMNGGVMNDELRGMGQHFQVSETWKVSEPALSMRLVPNPATTQVEIWVGGMGSERLGIGENEDKGGDLSVFDGQGRMVWQQTIEPSSAPNPQPIVLNLADFIPGLYRVCLRTEGSVVTKALVVSR